MPGVRDTHIMLEASPNSSEPLQNYSLETYPGAESWCNGGPLHTWELSELSRV